MTIGDDRPPGDYQPGPRDLVDLAGALLPQSMICDTVPTLTGRILMVRMDCHTIAGDPRRVTLLMTTDTAAGIIHTFDQSARAAWGEEYTDAIPDSEQTQPVPPEPTVGGGQT